MNWPILDDGYITIFGFGFGICEFQICQSEICQFSCSLFAGLGIFCPEGARNNFSVEISRNWSNWVEVPVERVEECPSTRTKDEDEHDFFAASRGGCFNAGRSLALPILLSFFTIRLLSAPPAGSVSASKGRADSVVVGRFGASVLAGGNVCFTRPEASLPTPICAYL